MGIQPVDIQTFLELSTQFPIVDVRSPAEYGHAHIPGALSLPLFSDEERKQVGTTYKQKSREQAIKLGLDYFGPKMKHMIEEAEKILKPAQTNTLLIHCWRGGMRSAGVAWLMDLYGIKVYTLQGGYKAYRNYVLQKMEEPFTLKVLGGFTGSGKTEILQALENKGEVVIDLEKIAGHRGSAFGNLGLPPQSSIEQFENNLIAEMVKALQKMQTMQKKHIWIEDESRQIGNVNLPNSFFSTLRQSPVLFIDIPFETRLEKVIEVYGNFEKEKLGNAIQRITRRLGGLETKQALELLQENNIRECFRILLTYYDKFYSKSGLQEKRNMQTLKFEELNIETITNHLIKC